MLRTFTSPSIREPLNWRCQGLQHELSFMQSKYSALELPLFLTCVTSQISPGCRWLLLFPFYRLGKLRPTETWQELEYCDCNFFPQSPLLYLIIETPCTCKKKQNCTDTTMCIITFMDPASLKNYPGRVNSSFANLSRVNKNFFF